MQGEVFIVRIIIVVEIRRFGKLNIIFISYSNRKSHWRVGVVVPCLGSRDLDFDFSLSQSCNLDCFIHDSYRFIFTYEDWFS